MTPTVLLTGFEPFDGGARNPSIEAVRAVDQQWDRSERLVTAELPVSYRRAAAQLDLLLAEHEPTHVIATGLAGGRQGVSLERLAVNLCDARIPDNDGEQPVDAPVIEGGPLAHRSSLPVKRAVAALERADIPAATSMTAGTYVCNAAFYQIAGWAQERPGLRRAGFVHVPTAERLQVSTIARALRIVIEVALDPAPDLTHACGSPS